MLDDDWALFERDDKRPPDSAWRAYRVVCVGDEPERMRVNVRLSRRRKFDLGWNGERLGQSENLKALRLRYPHFEPLLLEAMTRDGENPHANP